MLRLRTFGTIDLRGDDGGELRAVLAQPKRIGLLAYLALATRGEWQRRDRLVALFWPELDAEHARNALNQALFFLRRHLGADTILTRNSEEIALAPEALWCDAAAFDDAVGAARYTEAIDLYHGELLASFHVPETAAELERWIDAERQRLARQFARAVEALAEEREQQRDFAGAVGWWRRLAAHDPHDGHVALRLMRALAAAGDRTAALEHARVYTMLLRQALELEPNADIAAFVNQLRKHPLEISHPPMTQTSEDAAVDSSRQIPRPSQTEPPRPTRRISVAGATAALAVIVAMGFAYFAYARLTAPRVRSIAVIPFENLTGDSTKEYLADVLTDEIITDLARYDPLIVKSRTSILQYKGVKRSITEIAKELGADAIVEGRIAGDQHSIQVTAQLIYGPNDKHIWADKYVRDSANVLAIEGDIANAIAREVHLRTTPAGSSIGRRMPNGIAYALYLRGQERMLSRTPKAMREAATYFQQSIVKDSTFALGYAGLAEVCIISADDNYLPLQIATDSALRMAEYAVKLDSSLSEAYTALAAAYEEEANWHKAEEAYKRAIDLAPSNALARHWYAQYLAVQGRLQEALAQISVGRAIDPLSASMARAGGAIQTAAGAGRPSIEQAGEAVVRDPLHAWSRATYANRLSQEGRCPEARANIDSAKVLIEDNMRMLVSVFAVEYRCGDRKKAMAMLHEMKHRPDARPKGFWIAGVYNAWNQRDSAFAWLDGAEWTRDMRFNFLLSKPWSAVKTDPRYQSVLRQMKVVE